MGDQRGSQNLVDLAKLRQERYDIHVALRRVKHVLEFAMRLTRSRTPTGQRHVFAGKVPA